MADQHSDEFAISIKRETVSSTLIVTVIGDSVYIYSEDPRTIKLSMESAVHLRRMLNEALNYCGK